MNTSEEEAELMDAVLKEIYNRSFELYPTSIGRVKTGIPQSRVPPNATKKKCFEIVFSGFNIFFAKAKLGRNCLSVKSEPKINLQNPDIEERSNFWKVKSNLVQEPSYIHTSFYRKRELVDIIVDLFSAELFRAHRKIRRPRA